MLCSICGSNRLGDWTLLESSVMQVVDNGGFLVQNCVNLNMHGPATLTYATAALGFSQVQASISLLHAGMHASSSCRQPRCLCPVQTALHSLTPSASSE